MALRTYKVTIEQVDPAALVSTGQLIPGSGRWNKGVDSPISIIVPLDNVLALPALLGFLVLVKEGTPISQVYDAVIVSGPPT